MSEDYNNDSPVWKIEGEQEWRKGNTQIKLSPKAYKIVFRDLEGYQTPKPQIVYVVANQTVQINANYTYVGDAQTSSSQEQSSSEDPSSGEEGGSGETSSGSAEEGSSTEGWENPNEDIFHFVAVQKDSKIYFINNIGRIHGGGLSYSINNCETWNQWDGNTITLDNIGDTIYFRGKSNFTANDSHFVINGGKVAAYGNIMSLLGDETCTTLTSYKTFAGLFSGCTKLTRAPKLPATKLSSNCYQSLFHGCTSLEEPPVLPSTELASHCYESMFRDCTSLKYAPVLPASNLEEGCYDWMFCGCASIVIPPTLASLELKDYCYRGMFAGCTSLTEMPDLPATIVKEGCYYEMFKNCSSLTSIKNLPCEDLHTKAYYRMFQDCTNLVEVNLPFTSLSVESCYEMFRNCLSLKKLIVNFESWFDENNATKDWFRDVPSGGEFVAPESLPEIRGTSNIPSGWTLTRKSDD